MTGRSSPGGAPADRARTRRGRAAAAGRRPGLRRGADEARRGGRDVRVEVDALASALTTVAATTVFAVDELERGVEGGGAPVATFATPAHAVSAARPAGRSATATPAGASGERAPRGRGEARRRHGARGGAAPGHRRPRAPRRRRARPPRRERGGGPAGPSRRGFDEVAAPALAPRPEDGVAERGSSPAKTSEDDERGPEGGQVEQHGRAAVRLERSLETAGDEHPSAWRRMKLFARARSASGVTTPWRARLTGEIVASVAPARNTAAHIAGKDASGTKLATVAPPTSRARASCGGAPRRPPRARRSSRRSASCPRRTPSRARCRSGDGLSSTR